MCLKLTRVMVGQVLVISLVGYEKKWNSSRTARLVSRVQVQLSGLCWDIQQRETDEISDGDSSPQLHRWARRDHQLSTHALWRVNTQSAPTQPTLLSQVQPASCLCAETWQANTLNVLQDDNISGWTGQHRAAPAAPWWSLMWHTWAN